MSGIILHRPTRPITARAKQSVTITLWSERPVYTPDTGLFYACQIYVYLTPSAASSGCQRRATLPCTTTPASSWRAGNVLRR